MFRNRYIPLNHHQNYVRNCYNTFNAQPHHISDERVTKINKKHTSQNHFFRRKNSINPSSKLKIESCETRDIILTIIERSIKLFLTPLFLTLSSSPISHYFSFSLSFIFFRRLLSSLDMVFW
jgi:hypothetical protein